MIRFRHGALEVTLSGGDFWSPRAGGEKESYRDAPASELWSMIAEIESGLPWRDVVSQRFAASSPWLHRIVTDPDRDLFFRQNPPVPGSRVLDIGAGWGQVALPLARSNSVTALEPTAERLAFIRAAARQEKLGDQVTFIQADFLDLEFQTRFDLVCCIGVLEWIPKFYPGDPLDAQRLFLSRIRSLLSPGGQLVIGIENRLGLKYVMGAPDDHLGIGNIAVFDSQLAAAKWRAYVGQELRSLTFTRAELTDLLTTAGFSDHRFFGAFPDYKVPHLILPAGNEINRYFSNGGYVPEHDGSSGQPLPFQDELRSHYRSLAQLNIAHEFAPSFYVVAMC